MTNRTRAALMALLIYGLGLALLIGLIVTWMPGEWQAPALAFLAGWVSALTWRAWRWTMDGTL